MIRCLQLLLIALLLAVAGCTQPTSANWENSEVDRYALIEEGMDYQQVRALLGPPDKQTRYTGEGGQPLANCRWVGRRTMIQVYFQDGEVVGKQRTQ